MRRVSIDPSTLPETLEELGSHAPSLVGVMKGVTFNSEKQMQYTISRVLKVIYILTTTLQEEFHHT